MMKRIVIILAIISNIAFAQENQEQKYSCDDGKRTCKAMNSCAEVKFYLNQCGVSRLDRDKDGIPCESLCRK